MFEPVTLPWWDHIFADGCSIADVRAYASPQPHIFMVVLPPGAPYDVERIWNHHGQPTNWVTRYDTPNLPLLRDVAAVAHGVSSDR